MSKNKDKVTSAVSRQSELKATLTEELHLITTGGNYEKADLTLLKNAFCPALGNGGRVIPNEDIVIKYETNCAERTCIVKVGIMAFDVETISIVDLDVNEETDSMSNANCIEMTNIILVMGRLQVRWEDELV